MYKFILVVVITIVSVFRSMAQERVAIHSSGTYFVQPVKDKKWKNVNGEDFTEATYKFYSGLTYITITSAQDTEIELDYTLTVKKGELQMEVTDDEGKELFVKSVTVSQNGTVRLKLSGGTIYKVNFRGKDTSGSYKARWKQM
ncbi:hypothetical protein [Flavobacterium sp.]|uniref:hypothetical protein n=1 Tax=Flavobacterium sp. TaxID=239 RepID=UPI004034B70A